MTKTWTLDTPLQIDLPEQLRLDCEGLLLLDPDVGGLSFTMWRGYYDDTAGGTIEHISDGWMVMHLTADRRTKEALAARNPNYARKAWLVESSWGAIGFNLPGAETAETRRSLLVLRGAMFALGDPMLVEHPFDSVNQEALSETKRISGLHPIIAANRSGHAAMEQMAQFRRQLPWIAAQYDELAQTVIED